MKKIVLILFSCICAVTFVLFIYFNFFYANHDFDSCVEKYAKEYNLETEFVYAIIKAESDFREDAVSRSGALGLMQIIPSTAKWIAGEFNEKYEKEKLLTAETNIKYGCFYLNYLFSKFKNQDVVICAYNEGETVVRKWLDENDELDEDKIEYEETRVYLERVRKFYEMFKS